MNTVSVNLNQEIGVINPNIYGHFIEHIGGVIYDGIWVGTESSIPNEAGLRLDLIESLKRLEPPVIRWPGGCFAEAYHWRDGIGPRAQRPVRNGWWQRLDGFLENNHFGTEEFMRFCRSIAAEPYLAAGVSGVTPMEIRDWVDYCNAPRGTTTLAQEREQNGSGAPHRVRYWGLGNENWGFGGNYTPETYCADFRRFSSIVAGPTPAVFPDSTFRGYSFGDAESLKFIACGPNGDDYEWTERFFKAWKPGSYDSIIPIDGYSLHYYCGTTGSATRFNEPQWYELIHRALEMEQLIDRHRAIMDRFDPDRRISLVIDEWGTWHEIGSGPTRNEYQFEQQSTMRDAVIAALTLNTFNNRADVVGMANISQLVNCLQSLYLANGDSFIETPVFHVFDMYRRHKGARAVPVCVSGPSIEFEYEGEHKHVPQISCSASLTNGLLCLTLANLDISSSARVRVNTGDRNKYMVVRRCDLHADDPQSVNDTDSPTRVSPVECNLRASTDELLELAPAAVVRVELEAVV